MAKTIKGNGSQEDTDSLVKLTMCNSTGVFGRRFKICSFSALVKDHFFISSKKAVTCCSSCVLHADFSNAVLIYCQMVSCLSVDRANARRILPRIVWCVNSQHIQYLGILSVSAFATPFVRSEAVILQSHWVMLLVLLRLPWCRLEKWFKKKNLSCKISQALFFFFCDPGTFLTSTRDINRTLYYLDSTITTHTLSTTQAASRRVPTLTGNFLIAIYCL